MSGLLHGFIEPCGLLIPDVMLPGLDSFRILKELRRERNSVPVLMLTAKTNKISHSNLNERIKIHNPDE